MTGFFAWLGEVVGVPRRKPDTRSAFMRKLDVMVAEAMREHDRALWERDGPKVKLVVARVVLSFVAMLLVAYIAGRLR